MGTTLTGTTPQDTYDSLIKVTDNGPLSGTLKALSDGLGNDSTLSLSTTAASIAGTLAVTGASTFNGLPTVNLAADNTTVGIFHTGGGPANKGLKISTFASVNDNAGVTLDAQTSTGVLAFATVSTERMRITSAGNVGIGTSSPANKLVVKAAGYGAVASFLDTADNGFVFKADAFNGFNAIDQTQQLIMNFGGAEKYRFNTDGVLAVGSGIQFPATQVASANVNTLDDYEEGTWTMGVSFGGASVGVTSSSNTGTYTKIGRQVTVNAVIFLTSKGSSTGDARITGLPFTIPNSPNNYSSPSLYFAAINFTNQFQGYGEPSTTTIALREITLLGTESSLTNDDFANNSTIIVSFTYFV